tara:strand:+ start:698 stop:868 length:171 start_codon:yes stop_codon:yes gene_type:complete
MKIGDLVRYGNNKDYGLGIVVKIEDGVDREAVTVSWFNGVTSSHSERWIIRIKESA